MRKYYALTDLGRRELEVEKERWMSVHGAFLRLWSAAEGPE
jgi:DNA-binding PadR family transcriptional regulator